MNGYGARAGGFLLKKKNSLKATACVDVARPVRESVGEEREGGTYMRIHVIGAECLEEHRREHRLADAPCVVAAR